MKPLHKNAKDLTGMQFGRLTVKKFYGRNKTGRLLWECECDCGSTVVRLGEALRGGYTKSCGCYNREIAKKTKYKHGGCPNYGHERLFNVWNMMKQRCLNPHQKAYKNYGGRGITICEEWANDYAKFRDWAIKNGYDETAKTRDCTIDRIDNNKGYFPENCRWVDQMEQANNCRKNHFIVYNGERLTVAQASRKYDVPYSTLLHRVNRGWTSKDAIETKKGAITNYGKRNRDV